MSIADTQKTAKLGGCPAKKTGTLTQRASVPVKKESFERLLPVNASIKNFFYPCLFARCTNFFRKKRQIAT